MAVIKVKPTRVVALKSIIEEAVEQEAVFHLARIVVYFVLVWCVLAVGRTPISFDFHVAVQKQVESIAGSSYVDVQDRIGWSNWVHAFMGELINRNFWLHEFIRVEMMLIRFYRIKKNDGCITDESIRNCLFMNDFVLSDDAQVQVPFGPPDDPERYTPIRNPNPFGTLVYPYIAFHKFMFPENMTEARMIMQQLKDDKILESYETYRSEVNVVVRDAFSPNLRYYVHVDINGLDYAPKLLTPTSNAGLMMSSSDYTGLRIFLDILLLVFFFSDLGFMINGWREISRRKIKVFLAPLRISWTYVEIFTAAVFAMWAFFHVVALWVPKEIVMYSDSPLERVSKYARNNLESIVCGAETYAGFCLLGTLAVRIYKAIRLFSGMRVFTQILSNSWAHLKDFLVFFGVCVFFIALFLYGTLGNAGGNFAFSTIRGAFRETLRMSVGFYSFEDLVNNYTGVWQFSILVDLAFFLLVAVLILVGQNVILAIVVNAYEESKQRNNLKEGSERAFLVTIGLRIFFLSSTMLSRFLWVFKNRGNSNSSNRLIRLERRYNFFASELMGVFKDILLIPQSGDVAFDDLRVILENAQKSVDEENAETAEEADVTLIFDDEDEKVFGMYANDADPQLDVNALADVLMFLERIRQKHEYFKNRSKNKAIWELDRGTSHMVSSRSNVVVPMRSVEAGTANAATTMAATTSATGDDKANVRTIPTIAVDDEEEDGGGVQKMDGSNDTKNIKNNTITKTADRIAAEELAKEIIELFGQPKIREEQHEQTTDQERIVKLQIAMADTQKQLADTQREFRAYQASSQRQFERLEVQVASTTSEILRELRELKQASKNR